MLIAFPLDNSVIHKVKEYASTKTEIMSTFGLGN